MTIILYQQGGGVTSHDNVTTYIDLIVGDLQDLEKTHPQTADLFTAFAKHTQGSSNFGFAEIFKDDRLRNSLSKSEKGNNFYTKLKDSIPLITVSNNILGDINNTDEVVFFSLSEIEKNPLQALEKIKKQANLISKKDKSEFWDRIEILNKILNLRPGLFGLSLNINEVIQRIIDKKRQLK